MNNFNTWKYWVAELNRQLVWINDHGGSREAYIKRYGAANDPNRYGNGGEAIYEADNARLCELREIVNHWKGKC